MTLLELARIPFPVCKTGRSQVFLLRHHELNFSGHSGKDGRYGMSKEQTVVTTKTVLGEVQYNDGEFAEVETQGVDGIETGLILETIQVRRSDTNDGAMEFKRKFRVGTLLDVTTTVEVRPTSKTARDLDELNHAADEVQRRFELGEI
jgi:hypothetical protein